MTSFLFLINTKIEINKPIQNMESIFIPLLLLSSGIPLLLTALIKNKKLLINLMGLSLIFVPLIIITNLMITSQGQNDSGGMMLVLEIMLSLLAGSLVLVGTNLDILAEISEFVVKPFIRVYPTVSVAVRNLSSHKTRATFTFAIFAIIMTKGTN